MRDGDLHIDHELDITQDVCPMTFVRTRLKVESLAPGELLEIHLAGEEPLRNVPDSLTELGHEIVLLEPAGEQTDQDVPVYRLVIRKA